MLHHCSADSVSPSQPLPLGRWVPSCTALSPLYLLEGKENPSHEKCIERIANIVTVEVSSDTGELFAFCGCLNKKKFLTAKFL